MWLTLSLSNQGESEVGKIEGLGADCGLHPLIHTFIKFNLTQDVVIKKAESKLLCLKTFQGYQKAHHSLRGL
jgi:hypothetical protein